MSNVGKRYNMEDVSKNYDVIVIGSGMGGLTTAALLSKAGKKVLVLEQHYTAGGFTHSYSRKGYEWDVGVHYIGDVHKEYSPLRKMYDLITDGELKWAYMDEVYDRIIIRDKEYKFRAGAENFKAELLNDFPSEKEAIEKYLDLIRDVNLFGMPALIAQRMSPEFLSGVTSYLTEPVVKKYFGRTTLEVLSSLTSDKKLIAVLSGQWGDYGLPPAQSSFAMHAVVAHHYLDGGNFPVGGASSIARSIEKVILKAGGKILVGKEVQEILLKNGKAVGVKMETGDEIYAKQVVSATGYFNTYGKLISRPTAESLGLLTKLKRIKPSVGHICLYTGIKATKQELNIGNGNIWIYPDYDHDKTLSTYMANQSAELSMVYISFPSFKDPNWETSFPGKSTIDVIVPASYEWFKKWKDEPWRKRGDEYNALKEKFSERLLDYVYKYVPEVKGKIDYYELSTPLSTEYFNKYQHGELYGLDHDPARFSEKWMKPKSPIENLYITGQDILFAGVASALASGAMTATEMLGVNIVKTLF
ncbi:MAG: NAD(P)/FAD-dependent oxidoreductase [Leptospiraceae bacterium]|nr:NAD(P)/FAD-dependent oxidoreductase [Leptospiraceae bacterium]